MSHPQRTSVSKEIPIERIFQKVMRRKMTPDERICFRLNHRIRLLPRDGPKEESRTRAGPRN